VIIPTPVRASSVPPGRDGGGGGGEKPALSVVDSFKLLPIEPVMRRKKGPGGQTWLEERAQSPPRKGLLRPVEQTALGTPTKPGEQQTQQQTTPAETSEEGEREAKRVRQERRSPTPEEQQGEYDPSFDILTQGMELEETEGSRDG
jgi:hypothetical protein